MQSSTLNTILVTAVLIVVVIPFLVQILWNLWVTYVQTQTLLGVKWVVLEVKPPKDVFKSPEAMELVINALYQTGGTGNWYAKYWKGGVRNYFSLEIVSTEGNIHFYIRTNSKFRALIESQFYAQYPQAEIYEVPDYAQAFPSYTKDGPLSLFGCLLDFTKDEPYPIKTYVDYGLDEAIKSLDESQRIDPITPTLEFMGSIGKGEHIVIQMIVRGATDRFSVTKDGVVQSNKKWTDAAKAVIKELNATAATRGESDVIAAIERKSNKLGFDTGIRLMYIAEKTSFDANRIAGLTGMFRQYVTLDYNGFKPSQATDFDFPWQDMFGTKIVTLKKNMLNALKSRYYFYDFFDFDDMGSFFSSLFTHPSAGGKKPIILSTEELATLFHLPGRVVETPTFGRIDATKAEPPANLPV